LAALFDILKILINISFAVDTPAIKFQVNVGTLLQNICAPEVVNTSENPYALSLWPKLLASLVSRRLEA